MNDDDRIQPHPTLLKVMHRGKAKPVGKVFPWKDAWICVHESSGTQRHEKLDTPVAVDTVAAYWLSLHGIARWYHMERYAGGRSYTVRVEDVLKYGVRKTWDARDRLFVARTRLDLAASDIPHGPWITTEDTLSLSDLPRLMGLRDKTQEQGSLFAE